MSVSRLQEARQEVVAIQNRIAILEERAKQWPMELDWLRQELADCGAVRISRDRFDKEAGRVVDGRAGSRTCRGTNGALIYTESVALTIDAPYVEYDSADDASCKMRGFLVQPAVENPFSPVVVFLIFHLAVHTEILRMIRDDITVQRLLDLRRSAVAAAGNRFALGTAVS